jgi:K+-sensing histidine kinase KdpD
MIEDTSLIVNNSDAIIFSCDSKGIITSQIGGGLKLHGFYNGQHIGQNAFEAFADIPVFLKALRTALNGEKAQAIYKWGPDYCETRLVPKVGGGAIGVCTLQTERVLIQLENLQEKKNLNDLAHDIRGPLTGIQGILALGADQSQIYHKVLQTTVQSLIGVLDDTMKLEVYDSKISTEDSSNVDAHIPMKEVFELYKTSHDRFHFEIQASSENLFLKPVHRGKVYRILNNFINNACQHSKDMISVSLQVKGSMIRYNVIDNGPGIPKESHHTIFGPRPDIQYNTYRDESHGIGLYSCWKMCLQMNWDIGFFSDPLNNYTMFYLQLPKTGEVSIFK